MERIVFVLTITISSVLAQTQDNITFLGNYTPDTLSHSGSWGYVNNQGKELAIVGGGEGTYIVDISDINNIIQLGFIQGPQSIWREITVLNKHAYVVSEGIGINEGLQIIDLEEIELEAISKNYFTTAHMVQKNILFDSLIYVCGTDSTGGIHFLDVSNPESPYQISTYSLAYFHDCHVRGNTLYGCAIYDGSIHVVDISDRQNPVLLTQISSPFPHSCWTSQDNKYLFVCNELDSVPASVFNIEDLANVYEVANYIGDHNTLVHNVYINEDYAYLTHNKAGFRIVDIKDPAVPVETGVYDNYPGLLSGPWSAYPFFPSKKIIAIDRQIGLMVLDYNNTKAWRIYGKVLDSLTQQPVFGTQIITHNTEPTLLELDGTFAFGGVLDTNYYSFSIAPPPLYSNVYLDSIVVAPGDSLWFEILVNTQVNEIKDIRTGVKIYPNPFVNKFNINSDKIIENIKVLNFEGKEIFNKTKIKKQKTNIKLDLEKGVYFLILIDIDRNITIKKIVSE